MLHKNLDDKVHVHYLLGIRYKCMNCWVLYLVWLKMLFKMNFNVFKVSITNSKNIFPCFLQGQKRLKVLCFSLNTFMSSLPGFCFLLFSFLLHFQTPLVWYQTVFLYYYVLPKLLFPPESLWWVLLVFRNIIWHI